MCAIFGVNIPGQKATLGLRSENVVCPLDGGGGGVFLNFVLIYFIFKMFGMLPSGKQRPGLSFPSSRLGRKNSNISVGFC